ncbi:MAG: TMEM43 family protein [Prevotella sp.]|uniref:TMEM43 family protein n=1 Tax=Prevotella sp. TaxID=59823 RepID=UPI002A2A7CDC|nr:TMEM43 family protein [Prevotella sp.]MDD7318878.1 TMEM43 family protein [Prevotellaceae bacterium]MDY4019257.1 TMEM43 family protein [Prevotella sp.]
MAYTTTTTTSYGSRVKSACGGIFGGIALFLAGTALLWWNEGEAVANAKLLEEVSENAVDMENINKVDPSFNGQLVHATGEAKTNEMLREPTFGFEVNAINLKRTVEYYQWTEQKHEEKRDKLGGGEETVTTYTYEKRWVSDHVNSSSFADPQYRDIFNGTLATLDEKELYAGNVTFGAYKLPEFIIHSISGSEPAPITISDEMLEQLDKQVASAISNYGANYRSVPATNQTQPTAKQEVAQNDTTAGDSAKAFVAVETTNKYKARYIHQGEGEIYIGASPSAPQVGDVRVTFTMVKPHVISIISKVKGDTFQKYVGKNKKEFTRVENGDVSKEGMFAHQESENNMLKWGLRIIGIVMLFLGLKGIFGFVVILAKIIPFVSNILNFGVNIVCGLFAFVWGMLIIAIAWLFYRPLIAIPLLLIIIGAIVFFAIRGKKKGTEVPPVPGA